MGNVVKGVTHDAFAADSPFDDETCDDGTGNTADLESEEKKMMRYRNDNEVSIGGINTSIICLSTCIRQINW